MTTSPPKHAVYREIVLVRHGETVGDSRMRLYGATDVSLSEHGRRQMRRVGTALRNESFEHVVVSPLDRSRESASIILDGNSVAPSVVEKFREINFGEWEGWTVDEIAERDPETHREWQKGDVAFCFPGGETRRGFHQRVRAAVSPTLEILPGRGLWVLHKGIIKVVIASLLDLSPNDVRELPVDLGSIHRLQNDGESWRRVDGDTTSHLGDDYLSDAVPAAPATT